MPIMRRYRPLPAVRLRDPRVRARRRVLRHAARSRPTTRFPSTTGRSPRRSSAIEANYVDKVDVRSPGLRRHRGMLQHARSAFELLRSRSEYAQMRERQEGRYYGLGITIQAIDGDITVDAASSRARRRTRRASAAATSSRKIDGEDAKGWTTEQAMRKLRGPKGTTVNIGDPPPRLRRADRLDVDARRGQHPDRPRRS